METQTTITVDTANALAAMAFVVADQQQVIKRLREENDEFLKEYKESLSIEDQKYKELDQAYKDLQKQYDDAIADFNRQVTDINREHEEHLAKVRSKNCDLVKQGQADAERIKQLEADLLSCANRLEATADKLPMWYSLKVKEDENKNLCLYGFDHDGPVIIFYHLKEEDAPLRMWDAFDKECLPGGFVYEGCIVENGRPVNPFPPNADKTKKFMYLPLGDFISYDKMPY